MQPSVTNSTNGIYICFLFLLELLFVGMNKILYRLETEITIFLKQNIFLEQYHSFFQNLGVYGTEGTPVPFPNTEVKLCRVDGTAWLHVEE